MTAAGPLRKFKSIEGGKRLSRLPVASALRTLDLECEGLSLLREALSTTMARAFEAALQKMRGARGRVIVTGIGKSGHVGQKIAATFASTGRPAFFVHPTRGLPRRPRHDHARRRALGPVLVGRDASS